MRSRHAPPAVPHDHPKPTPLPPAPPAAPAAALNAEVLKRLLVTLPVTRVEDFLERGRTIDDFRGVIWMFLDRYIKNGDLVDLAKAILKAADLQEYLAWLEKQKATGGAAAGGTA